MQNEELTVDPNPVLANEAEPTQAADASNGDPEAKEEDLALTADAPSEKAKPRLWLALIVHATGAEVLLERDKIVDLRKDLSSPDVVSIKAIYRAIKKDFNVETQVVRKLNLE